MWDSLLHSCSWPSCFVTANVIAELLQVRTSGPFVNTHVLTVFSLDDVDLFEPWPVDRVARPSATLSEKREAQTTVPLLSPGASSGSFPAASTPSFTSPQAATNEIATVPIAAPHRQVESPLVRLHSDSGIRLPQGQVVDIPPAYTDD